MFDEDKVDQAFAGGIAVWIIVVLIVLFLVFLIARCDIAKAEEIDKIRLCNAIFKAEGGYKATYLYGIKSVKYKDEKEARRICLNSIRNNIKRWEKAGKPEDFITFMGRRYCPPINPKNSNWVRNVKYFYGKKSGDNNFKD